MINFEKEFRENQGKPFTVDSITYYLGYKLLADKFKYLELKIESTNSEWRQGIHIECDTLLEINKKTYPKMIIWEDTAPEVVRCGFKPDSEMFIWNVWDTGDRVTQSGHFGAAMIVDRENDTLLFKCNDGHPDDDFDDIIFKIKLVN